MVGDDDESSEASEVTLRSEEDEAAADGGAEAVVSAAVGATSRATPPSSASKVPMSGGASGAGRKVPWQHACACEGHWPLHALAIGQGWVGLQANAARRRDTSCLPVEPRLLNRSTGTDARTERYSECNKNCGHGETRPRPVPDFQVPVCPVGRASGADAIGYRTPALALVVRLRPRGTSTAGTA